GLYRYRILPYQAKRHRLDPSQPLTQEPVTVGNYGSEVRVWDCVIDTSFPSMLPVALTSSRKFPLFTVWRVRLCTSETSFPSTFPVPFTSARSTLIGIDTFPLFPPPATPMRLIVR